MKFGSNPGELNPEQWYLPAERKNLPRSLLFALVASVQAMTDAKWSPESQEDKERTVWMWMWMRGHTSCDLVLAG